MGRILLFSSTSALSSALRIQFNPILKLLELVLPRPFALIHLLKFKRAPFAFGLDRARLTVHLTLKVSGKRNFSCRQVIAATNLYAASFR
jgi:hypothetical protein